MLERAEIEPRQTARLVLRRPVESDLGWLTAVHSDPRNYPHYPQGPHSPERAAEIAEMTAADWARDGLGYWLIEHAGELIGIAGLKPTVVGGQSCFNLYYRFVPEARGRGFASEAGREALVVAALVDSDRPVVVRTRPTNEPARRLAVTLGLTRRPELDADDGFVVYMSPVG